MKFTCYQANFKDTAIERWEILSALRWYFLSQFILLISLALAYLYKTGSFTSEIIINTAQAGTTLILIIWWMIDYLRWVN